MSESVTDRQHYSPHARCGHSLFSGACRNLGGAL